ncbi:uncharacterized protein LOC111987534 [Quercus suber]|uniref:uncharacterized protein LOC111987534 n=1 Tax=Quercus suber TaxID=58331 RepID=UPI000CE183CF|nr:uncharacterized protein LOC111987534 [Quercus suber]
MVCHVEARRWKVFVDGSSNALGAGARIVIITPEGIRLGFRASNNEAEYKAFLVGLKIVSDMGAREVDIHSDSWLVMSQVHGTFKAWDPRMKAYLRSAREAMIKFNTMKVSQVCRTQNRHADSLATLASSVTEEVPRLIKVELIVEPNILATDCVGASEVGVAAITKPGPYWMDQIIDFLSEGRVPSDKQEANKVRRIAPRYWLSADGKLYQRSFGGSYLLCLHPEKVGELFAELHEGVCSSHVEGRSLAHRAMTLGFWWPQMQKDAAEYWAEAEALANIRDVDVKKFVWRNIVSRFGVLKLLIFDNGLQFDSKAFRAFCSDLGIKNRYSTPAYPQSNGQAEATNKVILSGLKKRLDRAKGRWVEELPSVLWAYRTTSRRSTSETPFSLTYGVEAVIPTEINLCSARVEGFNHSQNDELMMGRLNWIEECQESATIRLADYQQKLARHYNRGVKTRGFSAGDLVLRKAVGNMRDTNSGKLAHIWEGPYRVTAIAGAGAYYLEDLDERPLPRSWNVHNLKKFYH